jgi:hypothetical protein
VLKKCANLEQKNAAKTYAEKVKRSQYTRLEGRTKPERFSVKDDDEQKSKKWDALFVDCAFYFDAPTVQQEVAMKKTLQLKYDDLFAVGWRPALQTRKDLVEWACYRHNQFQEEKGLEVTNNCENPSVLITKYGPDYDALKEKLGYVNGLF